jgi:hypothetical protein
MVANPVDFFIIGNSTGFIFKFDTTNISLKSVGSIGNVGTQPNAITSMAYGNDMFVAAGTYMGYSYDGINWASNTSNNLYNNNGGTVAFGRAINW